MIIYKTGNIFNSSAQVITNPVNCVGVMGKGLALKFKAKFPNMFSDYMEKCSSGELKPGHPYLWEDDFSQILNFPTKRHWKQKSQLKDIEEGLNYLAQNYSSMGISSIAFPPLGCGLGGLQWSDVKPLINKYFEDLPDLDVYVYEPLSSSEQMDDKNDIETVNSSIRSKDDFVAQQSLF
ncbi:MAG: macro domain-containing protein [Oligoflexia bacterium]|nr:macro domain-containing protein [Oligoflexia bacterium]